MRLARFEQGSRPPAGLVGAVLPRDIRVGGERWAKGRRLSADDLARLSADLGAPGEIGRSPLTLLVLEPGDLHEDEAAARLAAAVAGPGVALRGPSESRLDLLAETDGVLHVRVAALEALNRIDTVEVFTAFDGSTVRAGQLVGSVKVAPHVVPESAIETAERRAGHRGRAIVSVARFRPMAVGVLVKESLRAADRDRFERSVRAKVESLGSRITAIVVVDDEDGPVADALAHFVRGSGRVDIVLTAGGRSTDPTDPFFAAIERLSGRVVRRGVPAHPGSMLWLARVARTAILGLPTCGAYSKATAADLLLPRLLTGEPASARTVARLGHGGILTRDQRFRFPAYARELEAPEG